MKAKYPDVEIVGAVENSDKGDVAYTQAQRLHDTPIPTWQAST